MNIDYAYMAALALGGLGFSFFVWAGLHWIGMLDGPKSGWKSLFFFGVICSSVAGVMCVNHYSQIAHRTAATTPAKLSSPELKDGIYHYEASFGIGTSFYALLQKVNIVDYGPLFEGSDERVINYTIPDGAKPQLVELEGRYLWDYPCGPGVKDGPDKYSGFVRVSTEGRRIITRYYPFPERARAAK